jgi:hypothetical protein
MRIPAANRMGLLLRPQPAAEGLLRVVPWR